MIDISNYTYADILRQMLEQVDDSLDKREGSLIYTSLAPVAWYLEGFAMMLALIQQGTNPNTATGTALDMLVATRGLTRIAATPAVRQGVFNIAIPSGSVFKTINGANSVNFISGDLISSGQSYIYEMTCQTAGTIGNTYTGNIIPVTEIPGLTTAYIGSSISDGAETESDSSLRSRFFETFDAAPYGGNISEYRQAILAIAGVGSVQVYPANSYNGGGTCLCSIINSDLEPASEALVQTVQDAICPSESGGELPSQNGYGIAPIGAAVTIVSASALTLNMSFTVQFDATVQDGVNTYRDEIVAAIDDYIKSVRNSWGDALQARTISYPVIVYTARVIYAILTVPQVVNVSDLLINGQSGDLTLTETSALQQIPMLGEVTITDADD